MLIGEHQHTLDPKNRISLPAKFRKELGEGVVITRGLDTCLFLFSATAWSTIADKLRTLPVGQADARGIARFMLAGATEVEVDAAGRVLIPDYLKSFAGLRTKVVLAGVSDRVELWDDKRWDAYKRTMERKAPDMAQTLGSLGIL